MTPYRTLPVTLLLLAGCATSLAPRSPVAVSPLELSESEWRVTDQVFVITDASGTMYAHETFPEAKALTRSFVASMPSADARAARSGGYDAASIGFGGDDRAIAPLAPFDRAALERQAAALEIMGSLDGMGGRTPIHDVLAEVQASLEGKGGRAALVIISDGLPDDPVRAIFAADSLIESYPGDVCFHTVQTGADPEGAKFLALLAGLTPCGSLSPAAELRDAASFSRLARSVFASPAAPPVAAGPCAGVVRLRGIEFGFDEDQVSAGTAVVLDAAADILRECQDLQVNIDGHTDWTGPDAYNQGLSERRARAVRDYFAGSGIDRGRLSARGFGESDPVAPNETADGRAQNRRVDLTPIQ